ncbi:MAG: SMP-30/gluconolactonase/LRE family protein [Synoicihabitans sp.]
MTYLLAPHSMQASLHIDVRHELAEGPVWHNNTLYWVNITEGRLYRHDATTDTLKHFDLDSPALGVALPAADNWWWTARERDCAWLHEPTSLIVPIDHPIPDLPPELRFNDGHTGPDGHPWVGSAALNGSRETAALYRSDSSGALQVALPKVTLSNGLGWSPDNTRFYYVDSLAHNLSVFDYDATSHQIRNRRILREFPQDGSVPDGLSIDAAGHVWLAIWGGSAVLRIHGDTGEIMDRVELPVTQVTSCVFGGKDGQTLFITSAWAGLSDEQRADQPLAGSIFQVRTDTTGVPLPLCSLAPPQG